MAPQTKARFAHSIIEEINRLPTTPRTHIRGMCGVSWQKIVDSPAVSWLDETTYNTLTNSVRSVLGDEQTRRLFRLLGRRIIHNPGLQSFIESTIRVFGLSPHTLLKAAPRGRDSLVRDSGALLYEYQGPRYARLVLQHFPASTFRHGTTVVLLSGTFLGLLDAAGEEKTAEVQTTDVDLNRGCCTFHLRW